MEERLDLFLLEDLGIGAASGVSLGTSRLLKSAVAEFPLPVPSASLAPAVGGFDSFYQPELRESSTKHYVQTDPKIPEVLNP